MTDELEAVRALVEQLDAFAVDERLTQPSTRERVADVERRRVRHAARVVDAVDTTPPCSGRR